MSVCWITHFYTILIIYYLPIIIDFAVMSRTHCNYITNNKKQIGVWRIKYANCCGYYYWLIFLIETEHVFVQCNFKFVVLTLNFECRREILLFNCDLYNTAFHCTLLYCTVLYCDVLYYIILTVLFCDVSHCTVYCIVLRLIAWIRVLLFLSFTCNLSINNKSKTYCINNITSRLFPPDCHYFSPLSSYFSPLFSSFSSFSRHISLRKPCISAPECGIYSNVEELHTSDYHDNSIFKQNWKPH